MKKHRILPAVLTVLLVCVLAAVVLTRFYAPKLKAAPVLEETETMDEQGQALVTEQQEEDPKEIQESEPEEEEPEPIGEKTEETTEPEPVVQTPAPQLSLYRPQTGGLSPASSQGNMAPSGSTDSSSGTEQDSGTVSDPGTPEQPEPSAEPGTSPQPESSPSETASGGMWDNELDIDP